MNRIDKKLTELRASGKKMLSPYITAGDPEPGMTVGLMHALVNAGADILELGIPFSDPMAEGPVIQHAMERALEHKVQCRDVLQMVAEFRAHDDNTPIVLMGYVNPIEQYGYDAFASDAAKAGVDGTILVDMPPEESDVLVPIWEKHQLYPIYLCSPTTSASRMRLIDQCGKGYVYYVSLKGVTGSDVLDFTTLQSLYEIRKAQTQMPLMIGFGIKTPEVAATIAKFADGVIVGAALIGTINDAYNGKHNAEQAGAELISAMRQAIDNNG